MSAYKFAGQLPVPTYDAEVLCGPCCSGGRVSFTATTSPEFAELYDVWVKAEDVAALAAERDQLAAALEAAREDGARVDWLERHCVNVADEYGAGSQLYLGTYATAPLRAAIDQARGKGVQS